MSENILFYISYHFRKELTEDFTVIQELHRSFVTNHRKQIVFGGVLSDVGLAVGVLYVIEAQDRDEAQAFLERDPYFSVVDSYQIHGFETKIQS